LTEIADIFPPTRFALDPTNLRTGSNGNCDGSNIGYNLNRDIVGTPLRSNNTYGLSREIEAVIQNTDIIRVSPSTFQPQQPSFFENNSYGDNDNSNVNNNDEVTRHGLFGTGTLFGEVWCAQELDGAHETYVICDDDNDNGNDNDNDTDNVSNEEDDCIDQEEENVVYKTEEDITASSFSSLAGRIHTAFEESANWRAGAETRREEESKEATIAAANKYNASGHFSSWMQGRYSPEVIESARVLGLITTTTDLEESPIIIMDDDNNNDGSHRENRRLTTGMIKERWHALAFQSHPDTADDGSSSTIMNDKITFSVLRQHYLTLIAAARQDERKNNGADEDVSSY
jgi:hypothetical protein